MKKILILLFVLSINLPTFAGVFEEAIKHNDKIFLYMYSKDCSYCDKFTPNYNKIYQKYNGSCKFLKVDANTEYGGTLMRSLSAFYVPYVAMVDNKNKIIKTVTPTCMLNYGCILDAVNKFIK